jgi:hypothetical protein
MKKVTYRDITEEINDAPKSTYERYKMNDSHHDGRWIGPLTFFLMIAALLVALTWGLNQIFS